MIPYWKVRTTCVFWNSYKRKHTLIQDSYDEVRISDSQNVVLPVFRVPVSGCKNIMCFKG